MKKILKITGIALISFFGLLIVAISAIVAVFSSSGQLTKIVKTHAPEFITCKMQLDRAELTWFKSFPNVGVDIKGLALINPMAGSPSDTIASVDDLVVVVDAKKIWKEKEIIVRKCLLEGGFINLYFDSVGNSSFEVFHSRKKEDGSFDYLIDADEVKLKNTMLHYADDRNGTCVLTKGLDAVLKGKMQDKNIDANLALTAVDLLLTTNAFQMALKSLDLGFEGEMTNWNQISGTLRLTTPDIRANQAEPFLENDSLGLILPLHLDLSGRQLHLKPSQIGLNQYHVDLEGDAGIEKNGAVNLDIKLSTNTLLAEDVFAKLPPHLQQGLSTVECSGKLEVVDAAVVGTFSDSLKPLISAKIKTDNAKVNVMGLPYPFTEVNMDAVVNLDLNGRDNSLIINSMKTKFNSSDLSAKGLVYDLLGDVGLKIGIHGNVPMKDVKPFVPNTMALGGLAHLDLKTDFTIKQLMKAIKDSDLSRLAATAELNVEDFAFDSDSVHIASPRLVAHSVLSAHDKQRKCNGIPVGFNANQMDIEIGEAFKAGLKGTNVSLTVDNFKHGEEPLMLDATLSSAAIEAAYDTIGVQVDTTTITFMTMSEESSNGLKARFTFNGSNVVAKMGEGYVLNTNLLNMDASINQKQDESGFLDRWDPTADVLLGDGEVSIEGLDEMIRFSDIALLYNSTGIDFKKGAFRVGRSDFCLQGRVLGIKEWMENHRNLMRGELRVTSELISIDEILAMTSGLGSSTTGKTEETKGNKSNTASDDPFMVPEGIDFSFVLNTKQAYYDNFDLNNLSGAMTVKDGTLILQEIGFTNKAAEMQLTAMYQSPRRNNLFLAMDMHLLNVQINDLLHMLPYIDTLVPMLKTFDGQAEFHIGAETNLKANYEPKISTLRAAADIEGKNLYVSDHFTFTKITDNLKISTNGEYRVDSLDVQLTVFKDEIDLLPSQVAIGQYKVTLDGRMYLDKNGEYHLSVTESPLPARFGLCISGPLNDLEYKFEKSKYPTLYKPNKRTDTEEMYIELKKRIADHLKEDAKSVPK